LWDVTEPASPRRLGNPLTGPAAPVNGVAFTADGHTLATAGDDGGVLLWDVTDPTSPRRLGDPLTGHAAPVNGVAFAPDGHTLATAGDDGGVLLWDVTDPTRPRRLAEPLSDHDGSVNGVSFAPDGHTLAAASYTVWLWDVSGLQKIQSDPLERACSLTGRGLNAAEWDIIAADVPYVDSCST